MAWQEQLPEWQAKGAEPPQNKRQEGWNVQEKPPADYFNWLHYQTFQSLKELRTALDERVQITSVQSGKKSNRPISETKGAVYIATDDKRIFYDDGVDWITVASVEWEDMQNKPSVFPPEKHASSHASNGSDPIAPSDIGAEPAFAKNTAFNKNFGTTQGTVAEGDHTHNDKVDKVQGKGLSTNDYTDVEQQKLSGIEQNANNYNHPDTHPASMITESKTEKFVSQSEKDDWNSKETPTGAQQKANDALSQAKKYAVAESEKGSKNGVAPIGANGKVLDASGNEVEGKVTSVNGKTGDVTIDVSEDQSFVDARVNLADLAIEVETMKAAELTGVDANMFVETFQNLDDVKLEEGGYDNKNNRLEA